MVGDFRRIFIAALLGFFVINAAFSDSRLSVIAPESIPQTSQKYTPSPQDCECSLRLPEQGKPGIGTRCVPEGFVCRTSEIWLDDEDPLPVIGCKLTPGGPPSCEEIRTAVIDPLACSYGHQSAEECSNKTLGMKLGTHCALAINSTGALTCELQGVQERTFTCASAIFHPGRDTFEEVVSCGCKPGERCEQKVCFGIRQDSTRGCERIAEVGRCVSRTAVGAP
jgi:hypothetical protein